MSSDHSYRSPEKGTSSGEVGQVSWEKELGLEPVIKDGLVYFAEYQRPGNPAFPLHCTE